ncbi:uncharacterized protein PV07_07461 [Cladophialophora immunda]|uniref:Uncharacterized protein n=1 Tax=Cladophialophora immunda TaxID=569365 RepID=A0A0D2C9G6_9EURO|nr:uncharacterized protein PV07_07461 [Cladophialophora immunda]KIW27753.1 hypothetical protein PV07_07461 [Cladophialophora immunda]OQV10067.1 hypothetical protein CLAIMM_14114 [Cladophialophora immunda]
MTTQVKSYFLAPNWDYQKDGPLALGNIIADPSDPVFSKKSAFPFNVYAPPVQLPQLAFPLPTIYKNPPEQWAHVESEMQGGRLKILGQFLASCGLNVEGGVSHTTQQDYHYGMESIQTSYFVPDDDYVRNRLREPPIQLWLKGRSMFQSKSLYMITGVKIARGLVLYRKRTSQIEGAGEISFDATPLGVPVQVGLDGGYQAQSSSATTSSSSTDVVFTYQLRKIAIDHAGTVANEPYNKGAFMLVGPGASGGQQVLAFKLGDHDVTAEDIDRHGDCAATLAVEQDIIDGELCNVLYAKL